MKRDNHWTVMVIRQFNSIHFPGTFLWLFHCHSLFSPSFSTVQLVPIRFVNVYVNFFGARSLLHIRSLRMLFHIWTKVLVYDRAWGLFTRLFVTCPSSRPDLLFLPLAPAPARTRRLLLWKDACSIRTYTTRECRRCQEVNNRSKSLCAIHALERRPLSGNISGSHSLVLFSGSDVAKSAIRGRKRGGAGARACRGRRRLTFRTAEHRQWPAPTDTGHGQPPAPRAWLKIVCNIARF